MELPVHHSQSFDLWCFFLTLSWTLQGTGFHRDMCITGSIRTSPLHSKDHEHMLDDGNKWCQDGAGRTGFRFRRITTPLQMDAKEDRRVPVLHVRVDFPLPPSIYVDTADRLQKNLFLQATDIIDLEVPEYYATSSSAPHVVLHGVILPNSIDSQASSPGSAQGDSPESIAWSIEWKIPIHFRYPTAIFQNNNMKPYARQCIKSDKFRIYFALDDAHALNSIKDSSQSQLLTNSKELEERIWVALDHYQPEHELTPQCAEIPVGNLKDVHMVQVITVGILVLGTASLSLLFCAYP